jgi:hypothetical protein
MPRKKLFIVALATLMTLGAATPASADCCDSFWDCAATVVTEGLSCAVQEFIDTVKGLMSLIKNLGDQASGVTASASDAAKSAVNDMISTMTSESQSSVATLTQAEADGKRLAQYESQFQVQKATTVAQVATTNTQSGNPTTGGTPPAAARPRMQAKAAPPPPPPPPPASPGAMRATVHGSGAAPMTTASNGSAQMTTTNASGPAEVKLGAPARAYMADMARAAAEISKEKSAGDQDFNTVNQYMTTARQTEGAGVQSALQIADKAIAAPFRNLLSQLTSMLSNPTDLMDPSSVIEAAGNSIMASLDVSVGQVVDAITAGPNQAFTSAQPTYSDIRARAAHAHEIASAMDTLYKKRTPGALAELNALLPRVGASANGSAMRMTAPVSNQYEFSTAMARFAASRQKVKTDFKARFQGFATQMAQYKAVRVKARTAHSNSPTYKSNFSAKLDATVKGKTAAQISAQRDSLIAEARTHFAKDPKTRDAVIALLSSEMTKRSTMVKR